jgi:hypothetical protein
MRELDRLRCQLRAVNIEYSAFVRRKKGEGAYARMAELRAERHMLMALIAVEREAAAMERAIETSPPLSALHREVARRSTTRLLSINLHIP